MMLVLRNTIMILEHFGILVVLMELSSFETSPKSHELASITSPSSFFS